MADDDGTFSVDIDELERGGVRMKDLADLTSSIYGGIRGVTDQYGHDLGGNGDIGRSFAVNYYGSADASLKFLENIKNLMDAHGGTTLHLGGMFGDVDDDTITEAGSGGSSSGTTGHRH